MEGKTMKIGEFAAKYGVTDRHARRLVTAFEADLVGHVEKRGNVGTWIDEYAEAYLRDKLRNPQEILPADETAEADPAELQRQINILMAKCMDYADRLAEAERRAALGDAAVAKLEAAEQKTLLLQDAHAESMSRLTAEHEANVAKLTAEYSLQIGNMDIENKLMETTVSALKESNDSLVEQLADQSAELDAAEDARKAAEAKLAAIRDKQAEIKRAPFRRRKKLKRELEELLKE